MTIFILFIFYFACEFEKKAIDTPLSGPLLQLEPHPNFLVYS